MCIILFAWQAHPEYSLVLAANRDEFFNRETLAAAKWKPDNESDTVVIGGRDLDKGGAWLSITEGTGRLAAVTNYRQGSVLESFPESRGLLTVNFLLNQENPQDYVKRIHGELYGGYNLLVGDLRKKELWWASNRAVGQETRIEPGVHGVSNHLLNTAWPKIERGKLNLQELLGHGTLDEQELVESLFRILSDPQRASDDQLPATGVELDLERAYSSLFVDLNGYGTRCSTVILVRTSGKTSFIERSFGPKGVFSGRQVEHHTSIHGQQKG